MEVHEIDSICVMTPHIDTEAESVSDALTGEVPDETNDPGFHRRFDHGICACGERFETQSEFENHIE